MTFSTQKDFGLSEDATRKIIEDEVKRIQALLPLVNAPNYVSIRRPLPGPRTLRMLAFDKANITDHIRQLERAFKDYGIVTDSEKKQCFAEYNISGPLGYNIRCNIKSLGSFSDPKVTWDDFKSMVKEEYKAFDLAK
ncbi:hypothetical protein MBM_07237 [Drepanopeziza brunnea f. sp. 'multigermtubi' MB_m1]|uniref:Uncharacterized protein n=1 Tax=Marssonina brunnea f. sp. multigermtubi (strain MB_m1) TaxID=1072389 RepID=K1WNI8_MARBU|nr:uncharacterized protein MBM_07237 [Drepanopeziza brunnea f. sp. 'multigermtubi' MB_m1]EKD14516.1 hypothetical protein MBM_07237 [Drepanopeziza brunnea f. sp. 'multigermtubi' MB_m1]